VSNGEEREGGREEGGGRGGGGGRLDDRRRNAREATRLNTNPPHPTPPNPSSLHTRTHTVQAEGREYVSLVKLV